MKPFFHSVRHALHGLKYAFRQERNFRIEITFGLLAIALSILLPLSATERLGVYGVIALVLTLELINTAIERMIDMMKPHLHPYVKIVKDLMAGAVLIVAFFALLVGGIVFGPYLAELFIWQASSRPV